MLSNEISGRGRGRGARRTENPATGSRGSSAPSRSPPPTRTPRGGVVVIGGNTSREGNDANNDIRIRFGLGRGGRGGFFTFPIDDVMNTLFAAAAVQQPVMTDNQLEEIPKATITQDDVEEQTQCAICFEDYAVNEEDVRKLVCTHLFHEKCIFPWLKNNATCPVCRCRMPNATDNGDDDIDSDFDGVVVDELSRLMEYRTRAQENRNGQSSANNNANVRPEPARRVPRMQVVGIRPRASRNLSNPTPRDLSSVQTRSSQRDAQFYDRRIRPETRASSAALSAMAAAPGSVENSSRNEQNNRRTNLRRAPAMTSLLQPSSSSSSSSSSQGDNNDMVNGSRMTETRSRIQNQRQRLANLREMLADRQRQVSPRLVPSVASLSRQEVIRNARIRPSQSNQPSSSGVTTRTRSRQNRIEDLNSSLSSSSSSASLVSISSTSSEEIAILDGEPPRRRRRLNTLSSSD